MGQVKLDVYFRGDTVAGQTVTAVRARLQKLFNADEQQLQRLFSGRPVAVRRDLDTSAAERYRDAMLEAGALVELRPAAAATETSAEPGVQEDAVAQVVEPGSDDQAGGISLAPTGADLLNQREVVSVEGVSVDTSALDLLPQTGDLLAKSEQRTVELVEIDVSHLTLTELPED